MHAQDIEKAELWLKAEAARHGWERAELIKDRVTAQGLIGVFTELDSSKAMMLEVNCETDFVSRNDLFRTLVSSLTLRMASSQIQNGGQHNDNGNISKINFSCDDLQKFGRENDELVLAIGKLGENIKLSRGIMVINNKRSEGVQLVGYTHAVGGRIEPDERRVMLGKYGTIVALSPNMPRPDVDNDQMKTPEEVIEIGKQLSQHIIGMNPKTIEPNNEIADDEPMSLLQQEFVFEEEITVADYLKNVNVRILDFVRFECGVIDS